MRKYRITGKFRLIGAFWIPGKDAESFTGTLTSKKGRVELLSSPVYTPKLGDEAMRQGMKSFFGERKLERVPTLHGFSSDCPCTLFNCLILDGGGKVNVPTGQSLSGKRYIAARAVMGLHLPSSDAAEITSGSLYFTKWHHLMPIPWKSRSGKTGFSYKLPIRSKGVFGFESKAVGARVVCEVFAGGTNMKTRGTTIKPIPRIRITPLEPKSVDWFTSLAFRTENFLSLFLGTSLCIKQVQLFQGDDEAWVVQKTNETNEAVSYQLWVKCPYQVVADAFEKWLGVVEEKRPVELTVLGMLRKSKLFSETEFLSLAQALEGFGRIRFAFQTKTKVTFASLIEQTYDLLSADLAKTLLGDRASFVKTVVQTRNYYTHLGNTKGAAAAKDQAELFYLNRRLQAFLRCVMLIDLGVSEQYLKEPILYQANRWRLS